MELKHLRLTGGLLAWTLSNMIIQNISLGGVFPPHTSRLESLDSPDPQPFVPNSN
jgi:hypothetical protein